MSEPKAPVVSALVVNHNSGDLLMACLDAFYASADIPLQAVVVDSGSSDGSADAVHGRFPDAIILRQPKDIGFGAAANIGLAECRGRFVLFLSPEVTLEPGAVDRLADLLLTRRDAGAVGPQLLLPDGGRDPEARRAFPTPSTVFYRTVGLSRLFPKSPRFGRYNMGHLPDGDVHEIDAGTAVCLMVRRMALDKVGDFDRRYFMFGEDLDLCYRLKLGGWKVFFSPSATAIHHPGTGHGRPRGKMLFERHRAMWLYHSKHHAPDMSAFANGLMWALIWSRWAALAARGAGQPKARESSARAE